MTKLPKLRIAALAALALGVFQLRTAQAAPAWMDDCDDEALAVLIAVCDEITEEDWDEGTIWYTCKDGHLDEFEGECVTYVE